MYSQSELETIKVVLIQAKQNNKSMLTRGYYESIIIKTTKMIDSFEQSTVKKRFVDNILKNSRGFTTEESEMHKEVINKISTVVDKLY